MNKTCTYGKNHMSVNREMKYLRTLEYEVLTKSGFFSPKPRRPNTPMWGGGVSCAMCMLFRSGKSTTIRPAVQDRMRTSSKGYRGGLHTWYVGQFGLGFFLPPAHKHSQVHGKSPWQVDVGCFRQQQKTKKGHFA